MSSEFGTYHLCEQQRFRRACTSMQSRQNLHCSLMQTVSQEEPSDRSPDPWPLWMAVHAHLKFVMTECSKTQIRLTRHKSVLLVPWCNISGCRFALCEGEIPSTVHLVWHHSWRQKLHLGSRHLWRRGTDEPPHEWHVSPAKTWISLDICPVWSESSLCTQWVAQDPSFLNADSKDSDQTGWMTRHTCHFEAPQI